MKNGLLTLVFLLVGIVFAQAQLDSSYKTYLGRYIFSLGSVVPSVEVVGDSLKALSINSESGNSPMEYQGGDKFFLTNFNGTAEFKRHDSSKQVIAVHIEAMGYVLDGTKENGNVGWTWTCYYSDEHFYANLKKSAKHKPVGVNY